MVCKEGGLTLAFWIIFISAAYILSCPPWIIMVLNHILNDCATNKFRAAGKSYHKSMESGSSKVRSKWPCQCSEAYIAASPSNTTTPDSVDMTLRQRSAVISWFCGVFTNIAPDRSFETEKSHSDVCTTSTGVVLSAGMTRMDWILKISVRISGMVRSSKDASLMTDRGVRRSMMVEKTIGKC